jgi:hypothetical protein
MDVRVIIACRPDEGCRVSVVFSSYGHVWQKEFETKHICLTELKHIGLLTAIEVAEANASDFEKTGGMLIFHANAEPELLIAGRFVQKS